VLPDRKQPCIGLLARWGIRPHHARRGSPTRVVSPGPRAAIAAHTGLARLMRERPQLVTGSDTSGRSSTMNWRQRPTRHRIGERDTTGRAGSRAGSPGAMLASDTSAAAHPQHAYEIYCARGDVENPSRNSRPAWRSTA
jgi:hypothetical protein